MSIDLPISKSIANRILMLQAIHGDPLMEVTCAMPEDVRLLHDTLVQLQQLQQNPKTSLKQLPTTFNLDNCGTAMRFLTAYCATTKGLCVILDGSPRLRKRPIAQLVDHLKAHGALIHYTGKRGYPPVYIYGAKLNKLRHIRRMDDPLSSQMISALMLVGIPVLTNCRSPYIEMTKQLIAAYSSGNSYGADTIEKDWSAAAFWYEYIALHGGELVLKGLDNDSLQGDQVVEQLFLPLGVETIPEDGGVRLIGRGGVNRWPRIVNFSDCPDLYPAVAMTYRQLGKPLVAIGTSSLRLKESDRLAALSSNEPDAVTHRYCSYHDHRIAMALMAADRWCDDEDCVAKSYPNFVDQLTKVRSQYTIDYTPLVPRRGINDDHLGKKHALHQLISAAQTEYVWLQDDDVMQCAECRVQNAQCTMNQQADLYILPLRMVGGNSLLERLQIAEYAAIQQVTMQTAKRGKAVLCSGANLLVNRAQWLESWPDLHADIPSGDDMFLLESMRRRGRTIVVVDQPEYTATISALTTWRAFLRQRMRWAGKAPRYTDRYIRRYGAIVLLANLLQLVCPLVILVKFPIEYRLIKKRDPEVSFGIALILEIVYPLYILLCIIGGLCRRSW